MKRDSFQRNKRLLEAETGTVFKDAGGKLSICLIYPNTYHVGMSNLGFTGLYTLLNRRDDVVCERAFLPDPSDLADMERRGERLISLESGRPLTGFDVIGFSVSFENDYPNVVKLFSLARIKPLSRERTDSDPLVIMGGPCAFMNPEPLADFADVIFVGEAEEMIGEFADVLTKCGLREEIFRALSGIEGFYIPSLYEPGGDLTGLFPENTAPFPVRRRYIKDIDSNVLSSAVTTPETEFGNMALIEAMRGCPFSCRFCAAGHVYNPPRTRSLGILVNEIDRAREKGLKVGLIAPSLTEYRDIKSVLGMEDVHFSITSLRASRRSAEIMALLKDVRSVSIAPEAGSQRLRDVINKKITEDDILSTASLIFENGIRTLRLYFLIGLPTETGQDILEIIDLVRKIRSLSRSGMISLTLSTFVPKPFTPFQWHPMTDIRTVRERLSTIKKGLLIKGIRVTHDILRDAYMQGFLARADRRAGAVLLRMPEAGSWEKACRMEGIDPDQSLFKQRHLEDPLPWDFIDNQISKEKLWREYQEAMEGPGAEG